MPGKRLVILIAVLAVFSTFLLFLYSIQIKPEFVQLSAIGKEHMGKTIITEGYLGSFRIRETYAQGKIVDFETLANISFYASGDAFQVFRDENLLPGSKLRLTGEIKEYNGVLEICLVKREAIEILETPINLNMSIAQILVNPHIFSDVYLNTYGKIVSITYIRNSTAGKLAGTEIEISDAGYTLTCFAPDVYVSHDAKGKTLNKGEIVRIFGEFRYNEHYGKWNLIFADENAICAYT
ncbi:MAG: hypothetical protein ACP5LE_07130 [Thermoplasmata archaeon]